MNDVIPNLFSCLVNHIINIIMIINIIHIINFSCLVNHIINIIHIINRFSCLVSPRSFLSAETTPRRIWDSPVSIT